MGAVEVAAPEGTQMGTMNIPEAILVRSQEVETILQPIPLGTISMV